MHKNELPPTKKARVTPSPICSRNGSLCICCCNPKERERGRGGKGDLEGRRNHGCAADDLFSFEEGEFVERITGEESEQHRKHGRHPRLLRPSALRAWGCHAPHPGPPFLSFLFLLCSIFTSYFLPRLSFCWCYSIPRFLMYGQNVAFMIVFGR